MTLDAYTCRRHLKALADAVNAYGAIHAKVETRSDGRPLLLVTHLDAPGRSARVTLHDGWFVYEWGSRRIAPVGEPARAAVSLAMDLREEPT